MRLSDFIRANFEEILREFEEFARSHTVPGESMEIGPLRDHAAAILGAIALDIDQPQTGAAQKHKSRGDAPIPSSPRDTAAEKHGSDRAGWGFTLDEMVAEYRALRATVLRLWIAAFPSFHRENMDDLIRFNEGIDQALAESVNRYAIDLEHSREMFIAIMGHDLRTPLSAIVTASGFLAEEGGLEGRNLTMARQVGRSAGRMNSLITDLLDFTRSRLGRGIPITRAETDLGKIATETIAEVRAHTDDPEIRFERIGNLEGSWDPARVSQALSNLVGNAVQHGARGAPIRVAAHGDADSVVIGVHNCGPGISLQDQLTLFDPYKRVNGEAAPVHGNLGLGLYISHQIALAHGGALEVDSSDDAGTTFALRLPRRS